VWPQMCADGGALSDAALQQLQDAAYSGAVRLEGGYAGWSEVRALCWGLS
jgi:rhodanese-related sulfurtransferase